MISLSGSIKCAAEELLNELDSSCLEVVLSPQRIRTNEGGMIRVTVSKNAKWYRDFCATYPSARRRSRKKPDTLIKRRATLQTLRRLSDGEFRESAYFSRLYAVARQRAKLREAVS